MSVDLEGTAALVTGAGSGLGRSVAIRLSGLGLRVGCADIDGASAEKTARTIEEQGSVALPITMDVTDEGSIEAGLDEVDAEMGPIDVLVNNAGVDVTVPVTEMETRHWRRVLDVNLDGPFVLCRHFFDRHRDGARGGHIVNIVSTASKRAWANASAYHASKWGLLGLSHALHVEGRGLGIVVTAVVAGGMRTPFILDRFPEADVSTLQDPDGVARAVAFVLTSPSGTVIPEIMVVPTNETSWP